jgi:beta-glucosidase
MTSFNTVDGIPSVGNEWLVNEVLRKEWGFKGVVISDFNAVKELITHGVAKDGKQATKMCIDATTDIEMSTTEYLKNTEDLIKEGKLKEEQIDEAVLIVLELKDKLGLFENPYKDANPQLAQEVILCKEHRDLARRMAEESAVLLKNNGILPFNKNVKSVAVIGPHANTGNINGFWSYCADPKNTTTVLQGLKDYLGEDKVKYAFGCSAVLTDTDQSQIEEAVSLASSCDAVILCIGEVETDSGEANSKSNIELTELQYQLVEKVVKANPNTAVALFTGRPLAIVKLNEIAPAILNMWMPGTEGGPALANLVFGEVSPSGRLTMTFPASTGQCPVYYNHYNTGRPAPNREITYGYCATYIDGPTYPLYPFGYGLTYSEFEYSPVTLSSDNMNIDGSITASVTVKNVGKVKAKEVIQMYIRDVSGSVVRPVKELKGFCKVELAPGESWQANFNIDAESLAFYGADLKRKAEKGKFYVFIGKDSDVENYAEFTLV